MERRVARRTLLAGAATAAVAGCVGGDGDDGSSDGNGDGDLPEACPTTRGLDVEWPDELTAGTVADFVEDYENRYYREVAIGYEPGSRLDDYRLSGSVRSGPEERDGGYVAEFAGGGALYRPGLHVAAEVADAPAGTEPLEYAEVDDDGLRRLLEDAVEADGEDGTATLGVETDAEIDAYLGLFESLFEGFEAFDGPNESATLYADVDGTTVELSVYSDGFHGDYWWNAWYYVDERVVRRTADEDADPTAGELLECRPER